MPTQLCSNRLPSWILLALVAVAPDGFYKVEGQLAAQQQRISALLMVCIDA